MGYWRVTETGSAWVVSTLPSGVKMTRLIGVAGEGVDCKISATGKVTFFAGRVPIAGELVTVTYRVLQRTVARLEDVARGATKAAAGGPGAARWARRGGEAAGPGWSGGGKGGAGGVWCCDRA